MTGSPAKRPAAAIASPGFRLAGRSPIERTLEELLRVAERSLHAEETARRGGLLQSLDARAKWVGYAGFVVAAGLARNFVVLAALFVGAVALGLLAAGSAWAEWSPAELAEPEARAAIAAASGGNELPAVVPRGLGRLATLWTAPLPDYAPAFLRSAAMGYLISALVGVGIIVLTVLGLQRLADRTRRGGPQAAPSR